MSIVVPQAIGISLCNKVFLSRLDAIYRVYKPEILVFSYPLLALKTRSSTCPTVGARMLPPKLYLVVFYKVSLVNWTGITCSDLRRPLDVLLEVLVLSYHMFIPYGGIVINVLA